ncbi:MAG: 4-hydroxy-tetrahydrodipicolinate reductase [Fuerstiella sp.]|nr:4-hydroxy-tetrahydrodipicolinate reductase [Fuerstiella sp.]
MSDPPIKIAVNGAAGRMGRQITALTLQDEELQLAAALEFVNHPDLGNDAGLVCGHGPCGVTIESVLEHRVDVVIDFSTPEGVESIVGTCEDRRIPLVLATTGLSKDQRSVVDTAAQSIPIVMAPNMSLAVNLVMKLVADAASVLSHNTAGVDVEIIERHHRFKEDAPSGTALQFGKIVAENMGQTQHVHGREGRPGLRPQNQIGYHALRTGDNVGEHTIVFGMMGETIDLTVRGHTRDSYAYGALQAARFLYGRGAGMYSMTDVLGFDS